MPEFLATLDSSMPLITALVGAVLGFVVTRRVDRHRKDAAYERYKLEQIQKSLDGLLMPNKNLIIDLSVSNHNDIVSYFYEYTDKIDYYWERAAHFCNQTSADVLGDANRRKKDWRKAVFGTQQLLESMDKKTKDTATWSSIIEMTEVCHLYKKTVTSILIAEAKALVESRG